MRVTAFIVLMTLIQVTAVANESRIPIYGLIIDKTTVKGINEAAISIYSDESEAYTTSDSTGYFEIHAPEGSECRICVSKENYETVISDVFTVTSSAPFMRIDMKRTIHNDVVSMRIEALIELAEMTYVEKTYDSTFFVTEIARIKKEEAIRQMAKGKLSPIIRIMHKNKSESHESDETTQYMMMTEHLKLMTETEASSEFIASRRSRDSRRLKAILRGGRNNA